MIFVNFSYFFFYCRGNPILYRDRTISMHQSSGLLLDGGVRSSNWLLHPAPASCLQTPKPFQTCMFAFLAWKCNGAICCVTSA